ncbi:MAG: hypothetical protein QOJ27_1239 [Sphingomonadales bacterium]|nr:hypothetical protein [Sphingomonadales bacterium]
MSGVGRALAGEALARELLEGAAEGLAHFRMGGFSLAVVLGREELDRDVALALKDLRLSGAAGETPVDEDGAEIAAAADDRV